MPIFSTACFGSSTVTPSTSRERADPVAVAGLYSRSRSSSGRALVTRPESGCALGFDVGADETECEVGRREGIDGGTGKARPRHALGLGGKGEVERGAGVGLEFDGHAPAAREERLEKGGGDAAEVDLSVDSFG